MGLFSLKDDDCYFELCNLTASGQLKSPQYHSSKVLKLMVMPVKVSLFIVVRSLPVCNNKGKLPFKRMLKRGEG